MAGKLESQVYDTLEKIRETGGVLKKGTNEVTKTIENGSAKLVIIADDVQPKEITMHIPVLCKNKNIPFVNVPLKQDLGRVAGLNISCAGISISNVGANPEAKKLFLELIESLKSSKKSE